MTTDTPTAVAPAVMAAVLSEALCDLPRPTSVTLRWDSHAIIHVHHEDEARAWRHWWNRARGVRDWSLRTHRQGDIWHHHQLGRYAGWVIDVTWLRRDTSEHADELVGAVSTDA